MSIPHVDEFVKSDVKFGDIVPNAVGPAQFVNLISNAEYVCTDSFHGSVFSTLYETPFFTFSRYSGDEKDSTNSRLYSFLKLVGMENRLYSGTSDISDKDLESPDFTEAKKKMNQMKQESENYLVDALQTIGNHQI